MLRIEIGLATGGTSGIGFATARRFVGKYRKRLRSSKLERFAYPAATDKVCYALASIEFGSESEDERGPGPGN